jgi:hypothetical protein
VPGAAPPPPPPPPPLPEAPAPARAPLAGDSVAGGEAVGVAGRGGGAPALQSGDGSGLQWLSELGAARADGRDGAAAAPQGGEWAALPALPALGSDAWGARGAKAGRRAARAGAETDALRASLSLVRGSQLGRLSSVAAQPPAPAEAAPGAPRVPGADPGASSSHAGEVYAPRFGHDDDGSPDGVLAGVVAESRTGYEAGRGGGGGGGAGPSAWELMSALPPSRDGGAAPAPVTAPAPTGLLAQAAALVERGLLADEDSDALYRRLDASDPRVLAAHAAARSRAVAPSGSAAEAAALAEARALLAEAAPLPPQEEEAAEAVEIPELPRGQVRALLAALRRPLPHPQQSRCM